MVEKWLRYWKLKVCVVGGVGRWVPVHCLVTATVRFGCDNYHIFDYLILSKLSSISISIMMIHFYPHFPLLSQLSTNYLDYLLLLQTERLYRVYILHLFSSGNSVPETVFREQWFRIGCITWFKLSLPLKVWSHFQRWLSNAKEPTHPLKKF